MSAATAPLPSDARPDVGGAIAHALRRLSFYILRNKGYYGLCVVMILGYSVIFVAIPKLVGWVVDGVPAGRDEVAMRGAWLLGVVLVGAFARYFSRTMVFNAAREVEYEIRNDLFDQLQRLPQSWYSTWRTGDIMSRCVNDLNSVRMMLGPAFLSIIGTPLQFALSFAVMAWIHPGLAVLVFLPYPAFVFIARAFGRSLHTRNLDVQVGLADLTNQVQESVAGISVLKAYAMERAQRGRFALANEELLNRHLRLVRINGAMPAITSMLPALALVMILWIGAPLVQAGELGLGDFFTFTMYVFALTFPTFIMGWVVALVQRGAAAMQRIDEILSEVPSIRDRDDAVAVGTLRGEIEFRDLTFWYEGAHEPALREVDLHVPAGTTLGVVGPVGAGKTTLAQLVPHLLEVPESRLFVDGVDVNRIPLRELRHQIASVPQDAFLFSMSLGDNVAYGLPETNLEQVREASRRAQLSKDLDELPDGFSTLVGERGVMLSGGQRQRTALARALALSPRILILDDTLSAVDAETENAIHAELADVFAGRTVIFVASRVSTVQDCDQIVVLDKGRIVERGTHGELLSRGGLYSRLALEQAEVGETGGTA